MSNNYYYNGTPQSYHNGFQGYPQNENFQPAYEQHGGRASGNQSFQFYASGKTDRDITVTTNDKRTMAYYLDFPFHIGTTWNATLHQGSPSGPQVCTINKNSLWRGGSRTINIQSSRGWGTQLSRRGFFTQGHELTAMDGRSRYRWKKEGYFSSDWVCVNTSREDDVVARLHRTRFAVSKEGVLTIMGAYMFEHDLILASALAIEEWVKEQSRNSSAA